MPKRNNALESNEWFAKMKRKWCPHWLPWQQCNASWTHGERIDCNNLSIQANNNRVICWIQWNIIIINESQTIKWSFAVLVCKFSLNEHFKLSQIWLKFLVISDAKSLTHAQQAGINDGKDHWEMVGWDAFRGVRSLWKIIDTVDVPQKLMTWFFRSESFPGPNLMFRWMGGVLRQMSFRAGTQKQSTQNPIVSAERSPRNTLNPSIYARWLTGPLLFLFLGIFHLMLTAWNNKINFFLFLWFSLLFLHLSFGRCADRPQRSRIRLKRLEFRTHLRCHRNPLLAFHINWISHPKFLIPISKLFRGATKSIR